MEKLIEEMFFFVTRGMTEKALPNSFMTYSKQVVLKFGLAKKM